MGKLGVDLAECQRALGRKRLACEDLRAALEGKTSHVEESASQIKIVQVCIFLFQITSIQIK